jgi:DNA invertase Pin-like site-specific DNA recombinase
VRKEKAYSLHTLPDFWEPALKKRFEMSQSYASSHNLGLCKESFGDLGISRYSNQEPLGNFLEAVQNGKIKKGSVLLVERLVDIPRQNPYAAVKLIQRILEEGVSIITLEDERIYTLASDPSLLIRLFWKIGSLPR